MNTLFDPQVWLSLLTLTALEVVLSVDNLVVIALLVGKLPSPAAAIRPQAWNDPGLGASSGPALCHRVGSQPHRTLFSAFGQSFTGKDLILIAGGIFLVYKAVQEIHANLEGVEGEATAKVYGKVATVVIQIAVINLVFSIDSIVTAVGLATEIWVMAVAVILSMIVLMAAARPVGDFVERHPTTKMLALSFLVMIGTTLVADGFGVHFNHAFIYVSMVFSVAVEALNTVARRRAAKVVHLHNPYGNPEAAVENGDEPQARQRRF